MSCKHIIWFVKILFINHYFCPMLRIFSKFQPLKIHLVCYLTQKKKSYCHFINTDLKCIRKIQLRITASIRDKLRDLAKKNTDTKMKTKTEKRKKWKSNSIILRGRVLVVGTVVKKYLDFHYFSSGLNSLLQMG